MPHYFASDVHLRLDRPDRGRRFAHWVATLEGTDVLTIVGDLCDFWFASRQAHLTPVECPGLQSLIDFRERGGSLTVMAGNHDAWLGPYYERTLGATFVPGSLDLELDGLRLHVAHGHKVGATSKFKQFMESRAFLRAFGRLPRFVAGELDRQLDRSNAAHREDDERRHGLAFERFADEVGDGADLVILGHLHRVIDRPDPTPRLIVPGSWHERGSWVRIERGEAALIRAPESSGERRHSP